MTPQRIKKINSLLTDIKVMAKDLPPGKYRGIYNRCEKVMMQIKKSNS